MAIVHMDVGSVNHNTEMARAGSQASWVDSVNISRYIDSVNIARLA
jgi:hypothetical protein